MSTIIIQLQKTAKQVVTFYNELVIRSDELLPKEEDGSKLENPVNSNFDGKSSIWKNYRGMKI
jgi:hypothetical protein